MKPEFQNQVILITGSSQGIGKALAIHLGLRGAKIGLNGRNLEKLNATQIELNALGIESLMVPGDVTDYEACEKIISTLLNHYGKLNGVVANGSHMVEPTIQDIKPEVFKKAIESQVLGAIFPIKAAMSALIKGKGYILLVSSLSALYGLPRFSAYSIGKNGHTRIAQSLRFELCNSGVDIGVAYVCLTKNEPQKEMVLPDGKLCKLPKRPSYMQIPREKVAQKLAKMIKKRKKRMVLSFYGKAYSLSSRLFPFVVRTYIKKSLPV
jgi:short-subunit dehydrogenase